MYETGEVRYYVNAKSFRPLTGIKVMYVAKKKDKETGEVFPSPYGD